MRPLKMFLAAAAMLASASVQAKDRGQFGLTAYIAGFGSAMNILDPVNNDVFGGTPVKELTLRVIMYCRENPAAAGKAIMKILHNNMRKTGQLK